MTEDLLAGFNPFDPATLQCPFPHYRQMREQAPVHFVPELGLHLVTRHDLVLEALRDPQTYSSRFGHIATPMDKANRAELEAVVAEGYPRVPTMLTADQPEHTRYRLLVAKAFHPQAIAALAPVIRRIAGRLIDSWVGESDGEVEFVEAFAVPLPVDVIAHALNVPDDRLADFKRWSDDSVAGIGTALPLDARLAAERGVNEFQHYFAEQLERRRNDPRDDLLTKLVHATVDDDSGLADRRPLDVPEMLSIVQQLLVAGNETTTKLLTELMYLLAEHPDEWRRLRADPGRIDRVVEEGLRLATPTQGMFRLVTRDVTLGGVPLPRGARLVLVFASANRDEALYADPDAFEPDRENLRMHLAFGKGIHFCLGANLARLEAQVALQELAHRIESFRLAPANDLRYFPSFLLRGLTSLRLEVKPG